MEGARHLKLQSRIFPLGILEDPMRLLSALGLIGILISATAAGGAPAIRNTASDRPEDLPQIRIISSDSRGVSLVFEMPTLTVEEVTNGSESFQMVTVPGGILEGDLGSPALPTFSRLLAIPDDAAVSVNVIPEAEEDLAGYRVLPMQSDEPGAAFVFNAASYARDAFDEAPAAQVGTPAIGRDLRMVALKFRPVRYNPATGTLRVAERLRVDVSFQGKSEENVRTSRRTTMAPSFDRLYRGMVPNYSGPPAGVAIQNGTYLIICPNDNGVISRLQPLVDWRTRKGSPVVLATTAQTGTSTTSIKAWIQNAYDTWPNPPEYICLVGDAGGTFSIPTWFENLSGYGGEGDHPYTQLEGGDVLADANIGRLSISSLAELETEVAKTVGYESAPFTASDPDWFRRACLVGDPSSSGISTVQVQQWIKHRLREIGYTQIDTVFSGNFVTQMSTALNRGDTIFSYRGYWQMSGWSNNNTYALTNGWKLPFVVTITCDTGSFSSGTSRSEGFLRAGSPTTPKGGLGAIGTATTGTHTRFNNCMHFGIMYGLTYQDLFTMGSALTRGKYELYVNYQAVDPNRVTIWSYWNNLMGDPAGECFTGYPDAMTVTHPASVAIGTNAVGVTVRTAQSDPLAGAQVCLWKGTEIYVTGLTDVLGFVDLPVNAATAGELKITVTKHNRYPYAATVPVSGATTYVSYLASTIDDDGIGNSLGNGDGAVNPGETVEMPVQLKNFGILTAPGVTAHVSTNDPYVQVTRADVVFGDIPPGGTAWAAEPFLFSVEKACPHGHVVRLDLDAQSGGDGYHSIIDLTVVSADLLAEAFSLTDVGANELLDPGETGTLKISLRNVGGAPAVTPTAMLLTQSEFVDVPDGQATYATIGVGAIDENATDTFTIHASPDTFRGYLAKLQLLLSFSDGVVDTAMVEIPIGTRAPSDPCGPDRYGYYAFDNTDTAYPQAPTYSWIELDGDPEAVQHTLADYGDSQDKSKVINLPFPFTYYGNAYSQATICSNGWLAMGSQYNQEYRNWTIPGAGGPQAMLAVLWDDLYLQNGNSKILTKHDTANHRFIIEWSRLKNVVDLSTETVEMVLYDPAYYPTDTGDGEILYQYNTVSFPDNTDGYATIGIENEMQDDGVLIAFFNRYSPGAAQVQAGRAIRFIPTREVIAGTITGVVHNQSANEAPLPGSIITVIENGHQYTTGADGGYAAQEAPGTYSLRATHAGFAPDSVSGIHIVAGSTQYVDFSLRDISAPLILHAPLVSRSDTIGPYIAQATISDYSPLAEKVLFYRANGGAFAPVNFSSQGPNIYTAQIPGQPWHTLVEYYIQARDSGDNVAVSPAGAPAVLYHFYVEPVVSIFDDDMELDRGWTAGGPNDTATTGVWVRVDPNGTYSGVDPVQPEDDHTADPGRVCWVTGNAAAGGSQGANDVDGGRTTITSPRINADVDGIVILRYHRWFTNDTANNPNEDPWIVQISGDDGQTWVDLENTTVSDRAWRLMEFDLSDYIALSDRVRVRFIAQDILGESIVEAAVDDVDVLATGFLGADAPDAATPTRFGLGQNRPNPFNPTTTVRFSLAAGAVTQLTIFDVSGRAVRSLVNGALPAGEHAVVWDGRDDMGRSVPSGIYLYKIQAGTETATKKMMLLE
jgi:hypothetical protein